jgi:hypothetical protein
MPRYSDNDKNLAEVVVLGPTSGVGLGPRKYVVAIHAGGVWFTPAQARKFAAAIIRAAAKIPVRHDAR